MYTLPKLAMRSTIGVDDIVLNSTKTKRTHGYSPSGLRCWRRFQVSWMSDGLLFADVLDERWHCELARSKIKILLRTRGIHDIRTMLQRYKAHIWGDTEYANDAILYACDTVLSRIDRLQQEFLDEMHLTSEAAFLDFNFAPPRLRQDIRILPFIHKRTLGLCHLGIEKLLPFLGSTGIWHGKQLCSHIGKCMCRHSLFFKSLFRHVCDYHRLQLYLVEYKTVKEFQRELSAIARSRYLSGVGLWQLSFPIEWHMWRSRLATWVSLSTDCNAIIRSDALRPRLSSLQLNIFINTLGLYGSGRGSFLRPFWSRVWKIAR